VIKTLLAHPLTRGMDLDDPRTTELRRRIIRENKFLFKIYQEWYRALATELEPAGGLYLELGSGAGFLRECVPHLITSEILPVPGLDVVLDGHQLPFASQSLSGIAMIDVLHHLPQVRCFLSEAARTVRSGGTTVMIEPWVSLWSRWVYRHLHHEPFQPDAECWEFPASGPLSGANSALPWMVFRRDRVQFDAEFPEWQIACVRPFMPFRYLVSGGVSQRALMPSWTFGFWALLENMLWPWMSSWAMFALIVLRRRPVS
jgi:SAM-dependent methyltransferase